MPSELQQLLAEIQEAISDARAGGFEGTATAMEACHAQLVRDCGLAASETEVVRARRRRRKSVFESALCE